MTIFDNKRAHNLFVEMSNNNQHKYTRCHFSPMAIRANTLALAFM